MDRKIELKKKIAFNSVLNFIKYNFTSFDLIKFYSDTEDDFAYYMEKWNDYSQADKTGKINVKICPTGKGEEHYFDWILSEIPNIGDFDEWVIFKHGEYKYFVKVKSNNKFFAIKELWSMQKDNNNHQVLSNGFFAINTSLKKIIDVGCYLGGVDLGFNPECYYQLRNYDYR